MDQRTTIELDTRKPLVEAMKVLRLQPGDVLVLKCPLRLSDPDRDNLYHNLKAVCPDHQCIVLQEGLELEVVRKD